MPASAQARICPPLIVSTIGKRDHLGSADLGLCGLGHLKQVRAIMSAVRHLGGDHNMMPGIDGRLDVVADHAATPVAQSGARSGA